MLTIDGRKYNLTSFNHPGGSEIIRQATCEQKMVDYGPMIRMYHDVHKWDKIMRIMEKYAIPDQHNLIAYKYTFSTKMQHGGHNVWIPTTLVA